VKKVAFVLALVFFIGMATAHAEITRGVDAFTGGITINSASSTPNHSDLDELVFRKIVNGGQNEYELWASRITSEKFMFSNAFVEIRVDNDPTIQISVKDYGVIGLADGYNKLSHVTVPLSKEISEKITSASRIAIRFQTATGVPYVYILPDSVLAEWQQVIATDK
jgi:hypothetical protein